MRQRIAARALDHLDHADCESACYRCLKSYQNQRVHSYLSWPRIVNDLEALRSQAPEQLPVRGWFDTRRVEVRVEGHTPCNVTAECPDGQTCDVMLQTCV